MRHTKADFRKTAECYVDAIRAGEIERDRAVEELAGYFAFIQRREHERAASWLRRRTNTHSDGPRESLIGALRKYLKRVQAR